MMSPDNYCKNKYGMYSNKNFVTKFEEYTKIEFIKIV